MTMIEVQGRITESGRLEVQLPKGLPAGEVKVRIEVAEAPEDWEHQPWTDAEIDELLKPKTREEFITWLDATPPEVTWADLTDDEDAAEYIHNLRHQTQFVLEEGI